MVAQLVSEPLQNLFCHLLFSHSLKIVRYYGKLCTRGDVSTKEDCGRSGEYATGGQGSSGAANHRRSRPDGPPAAGPGAIG